MPCSVVAWLCRSMDPWGMTQVTDVPPQTVSTLPRHTRAYTGQEETPALTLPVETFPPHHTSPLILGVPNR